MTAALAASIAGGYILGGALAEILDHGFSPIHFLDLALGLFAVFAGVAYASFPLKSHGARGPYLDPSSWPTIRSPNFSSPVSTTRRKPFKSEEHTSELHSLMRI